MAAQSGAARQVSRGGSVSSGQGWRRRLGLDSGWRGFARLSSLLVSLVGLGFLLVLPLDWMQQSFLERGSYCCCGLGEPLVSQRICHVRIGSIISFLLGALHPLSPAHHCGHWCGERAQADGLDMAFMLVLLAAELYAFIILVLGYIQTIRPLNRKPVPAARRSGAVADRRYFHSQLQRAAGGCSLHSVGGDEHGLARSPVQSSHP